MAARYTVFFIFVIITSFFTFGNTVSHDHDMVTVDTATDKTWDDALIKGPNGKVAVGEVMKNQETTSSDMRLAYLDTEMEEDEARSEATIRFTVQNFSSLKGRVYSPPCYVRNLPWSIMVMPEANGKQLGFYLKCTEESESSSWSCYANAEMRLISHKPNTKPFSRRMIRHLFNSTTRAWGYDFMAWNDVLDPEKGYIKNDSITLEVYFNAEEPHGVSWYSKKLPGYEDPLKMELYYKKNTNVYCTKPVNETQECYFKDGDILSVFCEQKQNNSLRLYKCSNGTKGNEDLSNCRATRYYNVSDFYQDLRLSKEDDNTLVICELFDTNNIEQRKRLQTKLVLQSDDRNNQNTKTQIPQPITSNSSEFMIECRDPSDESCSLKMKLYYRKVTDFNCTKLVNERRICYFKDGDKLSVYCGRNHNNYKLRIYTCSRDTKVDENFSECEATPYYYNFRFLTQDLHLSKENDDTSVICELFDNDNITERKRFETKLVLQPDDPYNMKLYYTNNKKVNCTKPVNGECNFKDGDKLWVECGQDQSNKLQLRMYICSNGTKKDDDLSKCEATESRNVSDLTTHLRLSKEDDNSFVICEFIDNDNINGWKLLQTKLVLQPDDRDNQATKTLGTESIITKSSKQMTIVENWGYWITRTHTEPLIVN